MVSLKKASADTYPALSVLFAGAGLKFVDIGGRHSAFAGAATLARFAHYYVSEPERTEAERLSQALPLEAPWRGVTVFTEAVASRAGEATLYMTRVPGMSSLLEPDTRVTGRYCLAPKFEVVGQAAVTAIGLDEAARRYGFTDAAFLKLDTQGTELDILSSGPALVRESLVGVHTEVCFQPFYRGQPLFADVDRHLRASGFTLSMMNRTTLRRAGFDESFYSRRAPVWAHCLYLREPNDLESFGRGGKSDLVRLLALAVSFHFVDLAFELVGRMSRAGELGDVSADQLLTDVRTIAADATAKARRGLSREWDPASLTAGAAKDQRRFE